MNLITKEHIAHILSIADGVCDNMNALSGETSWGLPSPGSSEFDTIVEASLHHLASVGLPVGPILRPLSEEELGRPGLSVIVNNETLAKAMRLKMGATVYIAEPINDGFVVVEFGEAMSAAHPDWIAMEIGQ